MNIQAQLSQISAINAELDATKTALQQALAQSAERQRKIESMQITIDERDATIKNLEALRREDENVRKKLHNTILVQNVTTPLTSRNSKETFECFAELDHSLELKRMSARMRAALIFPLILTNLLRSLPIT